MIRSRVLPKPSEHLLSHLIFQVVFQEILLQLHLPLHLRLRIEPFIKIGVKILRDITALAYVREVCFFVMAIAAI